MVNLAVVPPGSGNRAESWLPAQHDVEDRGLAALDRAQRGADRAGKLGWFFHSKMPVEARAARLHTVLIAM